MTKPPKHPSLFAWAKLSDGLQDQLKSSQTVIVEFSEDKKNMFATTNLSDMPSAYLKKTILGGVKTKFVGV